VTRSRMSTSTAASSSPKRIRSSMLTSKLTRAQEILSEVEKAEASERSQNVIAPSRYNHESKKRVRLIKHANTIRLKRQEFGIVGRLVVSTQFDLSITVLVILNALIIGAQVQHDAVSSRHAPEFELAEYSFTVIFLAELCARLSVHRSKFFTNPQERLWNMFDFFLVCLSLVDGALSLYGRELPGAFMGKLARVMRLLRIVRIVRVVRKLAQLRVMLHMIISSMLSLFWVLVIMTGVIYMVSVVLTQGATDYLKEATVSPDTDEFKDVQSLYGSLFNTMYTLFMCMSGGISWGMASQPMRGPGWLLEAIVISFVFFMVFAVANIVNGVFVDGAIELSKRDRSVMMQKQKDEQASKELHVINLLTLMDRDGDQLITFDEFIESLEQQQVRDYISALDVDVTDAKVFFQMLDKDGNGCVDIMEFTTGMQKFRGEAKSVDIHMMLHENKKLFKLVSCLVGMLWAEWDEEDEVSD